METIVNGPVVNISQAEILKLFPGAEAGRLRAKEIGERLGKEAMESVQSYAIGIDQLPEGPLKKLAQTR